MILISDNDVIRDVYIDFYALLRRGCRFPLQFGIATNNLFFCGS